MERPSATQVERARQLLALEGASANAGDPATAAGRVYEKLQARMSPLVGAAGARLLFVRSARLSPGELSFLAEPGCLEDPAKLSACLQAQTPAVAREAAAALFGTFLSLITTFIGERLTTQLLRTAWPAIEETAPGEKRP